MAGVTVLARVVGFGRWLVFSKTVGAGCLAEAYATANQLPNVVFEIVVGGALAGAVIPVLAGPVARGDRAAQGRIIGALLTWSLVLLAPFALLAWLLASQYTSAMLDAGADCAWFGGDGDAHAGDLRAAGLRLCDRCRRDGGSAVAQAVCAPVRWRR